MLPLLEKLHIYNINYINNLNIFCKKLESQDLDKETIRKTVLSYFYEIREMVSVNGRP